MGLRGMLLAVGLPAAAWVWLDHDRATAQALATWIRNIVPVPF